MSEISQVTAVPTRSQERPAKTQISLRVRAVWSESLRGTLGLTKDPKRLQSDSEDFDQPLHSRWLKLVIALL